jgi:hypothetical protein
MVYISNHLFIHLINHNNGQHKETVINSVIELFDQYLDWIKDSKPLSTGKCRKNKTISQQVSKLERSPRSTKVYLGVFTIITQGISCFI